MNSSALVQAHHEVLVEHGFVTVMEQGRTANTTTNHQNSTRLLRHKVEPHFVRYYEYERETFEATPDHPSAVHVDEIWVNDSVSVRRRQIEPDGFPNRTTYEPYHFEPYKIGMTGLVWMEGSLKVGAGNFTITDVRRVGNHTRFTFEGSVRYSPKGAVYSSHYIEFTIDGRGVIHRFETRSDHVMTDDQLQSVDLGRPVHTTQYASVRVTKLGDVTAPPPVWLADASDVGVLRNSSTAG